MIQQRAEELTALINRRRERDNHVLLLDGFRRQREEVDKAVARLTPLAATWHLLRARGLAIAVALPEGPGVLHQLTQLRDRYGEDPTFILGPGRLTSAKNNIQALATTLERQLLDAWRSYAESRAPRVKPEVLNVLAGIGALKPQVDRIWAGLRDLADRAAELPTAEADIDELDQRAAEVTAAWNEFDTGHLPSEVWEFLKEATGPGAALDRLTDSVRAWLGQHGLSGAFTIRPPAT